MGQGGGDVVGEPAEPLETFHFYKKLSVAAPPWSGVDSLMKQWVTATRDARTRDEMAGEWRSPVTPSPSTTSALLKTVLAQMHWFILGVILEPTPREMCNVREEWRKTLAAFRIAIPKCVVGYLQINSCNASLLCGLDTLQKKSVNTAERKMLANTGLGTSLLGSTWCICASVQAKLKITTRVNFWISGNKHDKRDST